MMVPQVGMGLPLPGVRGKTQRDLIAAGIPVYLSLQRATRALSKFIGYHEFHTKASAPQ